MTGQFAPDTSSRFLARRIPRRAGLAASLVVAASLTACMANPGPAPVVEPEPTTATPTTTTSTTTTTKPASARTEVSIGIDPVRNGFNPHLLADQSAEVNDIARLVLPSAFVDGRLNTDLLSFGQDITNEEALAAEGNGIVQRIRYEINPEAQWSDAAPITASDFIYLQQAMVATPGVVDAARYEAITEVRALSGGRVVEVDLHDRVEDWTKLFTNLLPSHLAEPTGADFTTAFYAGLPAAGARFMMHSVDRGRGIITLHRNDRFWGENPPELDIIRLRYVNSVTQALDLLRTGQVALLDRIPEETARQGFELLPDSQVKVVDGPRQLQISLNVASPRLSDIQARKELTSLIDVPLIARQAAGRSSDLAVAESLPVYDLPAESVLKPLTKDKPLIIAADPADLEASAAVRAIADLLTGKGINVWIETSDIPSAASTKLPAGEIDMFVSHTPTDSARGNLASRYLCPPEDDLFRSTNLTGLCTEEIDDLSRRILSGEIDEDAAQAAIEEINRTQYVTIPIFTERRVVVFGEGIVDTENSINSWSAGIIAGIGMKREVNHDEP